MKGVDDSVDHFMVHAWDISQQVQVKGHCVHGSIRNLHADVLHPYNWRPLCGFDQQHVLIGREVPIHFDILDVANVSLVSDSFSMLADDPEKA